MKILTTTQMRDADRFTIENEPIASIDLMERASKTLFDAIKSRIRKNDTIKVFCGMGNNGGDGLAVSRMMLLSGFQVETYKVNYGDKASADFLINELRLKKIRKAQYQIIEPDSGFPAINSTDIVIDAIFGSGLSRPLEGFAAHIVKHINASGAKVIAIDLPSGLFGENNTQNNHQHIIKADYTYTFQLPKLSFLLPENDQFLGQWMVLDIGIDKDYIERQDTPWHFLLDADLKPGYKPRSKYDHKGRFGHTLLIAGSKGKSGAAVLAARASALVGSGLVTTHVPAGNYSVQQSSFPEGMVSVDENTEFFTQIRDISPFTAIAAGPGLGRDPKTANGLKLLIQNSSRPLVLDADALNLLAENPTWLSFLPPNSVLTPHVGEFERMGGKYSSGWDRIQKAREMALKFGCYIVLKGAHTAIICPDRQVIFNSTGNPGMATGGSGDVLTGMITGFMAQGYSPLYSCMAGVFVHGLAADIAIRKTPMESLVACDLLLNIPRAIKKMFY